MEGTTPRSEHSSKKDLGNPHLIGSVLEEFMPQGIVENNRYAHYRERNPQGTTFKRLTKPEDMT